MPSLDLPCIFSRESQELIQAMPKYHLVTYWHDEKGLKIGNMKKSEILQDKASRGCTTGFKDSSRSCHFGQCFQLKNTRRLIRYGLKFTSGNYYFDFDFKRNLLSLSMMHKHL